MRKKKNKLGAIVSSAPGRLRVEMFGILKNICSRLDVVFTNATIYIYTCSPSPTRTFPFFLHNTQQIELPSWVDIVKTGVHKEQAPYDPDWFYTRAASMARQIYLHKGLGVGAFKRKYGGRKPRGTCTEHFTTSSGSIARHVLKQLESAGIVEMNEEGTGRKISEVGQRDLDVIAGSLPSAKAIVPDA